MICEEKYTLRRWAVLLVLCVAFLLVYATTTSPLTVYYGYDSAFFSLVGKGMTEGMLPYRDFFDMKGPYLFLLEYLGQAICPGRTGAFLLECVNLFFCLCLIDRICHRRRRALTMRAWLVDCAWILLPCLFMLGYTMEGGNLTEEYSLPLLLIAVDLVLKYLDTAETDPQAEYPLRYGAFDGFAFGVLALIRITNAAFIGAVLVTVSLDLLLRGKFRNLLLNGVLFLLGCLAAFVPVCWYYGSQGLLMEMLSQVFLFGVTYSTERGMGPKLVSFFTRHYPVMITMLFPMAAAALLRVREWRYWVLSISSYLLLILACVMGNGYAHYLTLGLPHLVLGFALLRGRHSGISLKKGVVLALVLLAMLGPVARTTDSCIKQITAPDASLRSRQQVLQISREIPPQHTDSVFVYNVRSASNWYFQADILPCNRYCDWHEHYMALDPRIEAELLHWLDTQPPQYIVTGTQPVPNQHIAGLLDTRYRPVTQNEAYILYTLTEGTEA